jgi:hypothetical protein
MQQSNEECRSNEFICSRGEGRLTEQANGAAVADPHCSTGHAAFALTFAAPKEFLSKPWGTEL